MVLITGFDTWFRLFTAPIGFVALGLLLVYVVQWLVSACLLASWLFVVVILCLVVWLWYLFGCGDARCLCVYFSRLLRVVYRCWIGSLVWLALLFCCAAFFAGF